MKSTCIVGFVKISCKFFFGGCFVSKLIQTPRDLMASYLLEWLDVFPHLSGEGF